MVMLGVFELRILELTVVVFELRVVPVDVIDNEYIGVYVIE